MALIWVVPTAAAMVAVAVVVWATRAAQHEVRALRVVVARQDRLRHDLTAVQAEVARTSAATCATLDTLGDASRR